MSTKNTGLWTTSFGQIAELFKSLEANGVTSEHLARLRSNKAVARSVSQFIVSGGKQAGPVDPPASPPVLKVLKKPEYVVSVNYDLSLEELRKADWFFHDCKDVTSEHFPTTRQGTAKVVIKLATMESGLHGGKIVAGLAMQGLRPVETHELWALGAAHPYLQEKHALVALGSIWQSPIGNMVPTLHWYDVARSLEVNEFESWWWGPCCLFPGVPI